MTRDKIFISYRRDDARYQTQPIYSRLERRFRGRRLFMDADDMPHGKDFRELLQRHLAQTRVLLVVIGKSWGGPRLLEANDLVTM